MSKDELKKQIIFFAIDTVFLLVMIVSLGCFAIRSVDERDEQIKILEQSLNEQIQEKEVYMKMLERNDELGIKEN